MLPYDAKAQAARSSILMKTCSLERDSCLIQRQQAGVSRAGEFVELRTACDYSRRDLWKFRIQ